MPQMSNVVPVNGADAGARCRSRAADMITPAMPTSERTPVTIRPLYSAPMIDWLAPSLTKKVPTIEVMMQTPPMASGSVIMVTSSGVSRKKIEASTMVATMVTA